MYAVFKSGGKQHRVTKGDVVVLEKCLGDEGDSIAFEEVLAVGDAIGAPLVDGATVAGTIVKQGRGRKVIIFKKKRRQGYQRKNGHRQHHTVVRIDDILTGGKKMTAKKAAPKKEETKPAETKAAPKKEAAPKEAAKKAAPKKDDAPAKKADAPKALFKTPAGDADDLKKISGVGPVLEKKLNDLGITRFDQIAGFSKADIEKVDEVLNFKGRIEREEWLKQASDFAKEAGKK